MDCLIQNQTALRTLLHYNTLNDFYNNRLNYKGNIFTLTNSKHLIYLVLTSNKEVNTYQLKRMGINNPAQRIKELRNSGLNIVTNRRKAIDSSGKEQSGVAFYSLNWR